MNEPATVDTATEVVIARFQSAQRLGALETTAINIAAWAWLDHNPGQNIVRARQEVRQIIRQHRSRAVREPDPAAASYTGKQLSRTAE
jgi:hypothetical protein